MGMEKISLANNGVEAVEVMKETRLDSVIQSSVSAICDKPFDMNKIRGLLGRLLS